MDLQDIVFEPGKVARITLNRPAVLNAQSWRLRNELDEAFAAAVSDPATGAIVVAGAGGNFSAGHDISSEEDRAYRRKIGHLRSDPKGVYDDLKEINLTNTLRWRNLRKPTIAMVEGYCIFGGWMIAAAMDVLFAHRDALFLPGQTQYFSAPWDLTPKRAKEILFEHRFMSAQECFDNGFVNRVFGDDLEAETLAYAERVADNYLHNPMGVETTKRTINHMLDAQGFTHEIEAAFESFAVLTQSLQAERTAPQKGGYARTGVAKTNFLRSRHYTR
ncbi:MAG: enoyl-CoA hydratase-related protein [Pseudomonadota bacterium]